MHSDGELFWWLSSGIVAPGGKLAMPGFAGALTEDQRWQLIDFIRARNVGLGFAASGNWPVPIRAPDIQARCAGAWDVTLSDLRGHFVRVVIGSRPVSEAEDVMTIVLDAQPGAKIANGRCVADDASARQAYAIVAGVPPNKLGGAQFLIDDRGWLRAVQMVGPHPGWDDPRALAAAIGKIKAQPLVLSEPAPMPMNMRM